MDKNETILMIILRVRMQARIMLSGVLDFQPMINLVREDIYCECDAYEVPHYHVSEATREARRNESEECNTVTLELIESPANRKHKPKKDKRLEKKAEIKKPKSGDLFS